MKPTKRRTLPSSTTTRPSTATPFPYLLFLLLPNSFATTDAATLSSSSSSSCEPHQATLTFVLQTDAQSTVDNSFRIVDASSSDVLLAENVDSNDAVISRSICVDTARSPLERDDTASDETATTTAATPRCYHLHLHDDYGDGLTLPHSQSGGSPGGWLLEWNGVEVARHAPPSCLLEEVTGTYNTCAEEFGFEFCGVRVCDSGVDGGGGVGGGPVGGAAGIAVTNLPGSQCALAPRSCPSVSSSSSSLGTSDGGSSSMADAVSNTHTSSSLGNALVSVLIETDSYSDDFSWEIRQSFKSNALEKSGEWLMGGGKAVLDEETGQVLLAAGAGAGGQPPNRENDQDEPTLADNESFLSTTCQPDDLTSSSTCYDLRAYDSYGDGLGCGADGSISFSLTSPSGPDDGPIVSLLQADDNFARLQREEVLVEGNDEKTRLACTNREGLTKWSYCAIRICRDGDVIRLPGNECGFGTEVLLDPDADGTIRPFVTDGELAPMSGEGMVTLAEEFAPKEMNEEMDQDQGEDEDEDLTKAEIFAAEEDPQFMTIALNGDGFGFHSQSLALNDSEQDEDEETQDKNNKEKDDQDEELSLAEQMEVQDPFRYQGQDLQGQSADKDKNKDKQDKKDKKDQQDKFDQLRPQSQALNDNDKKDRKDKNDKKNKNKNEMQTQSHQFTQTLTSQTQTVHLEPFFSNLLPTDSPHTLKYSHPKTLSNAIAAYVMNYLRVNIEGWRGDNPPIDMDLICSKDKKDFGNLSDGIKVWVVKCEGETIFSAAGPLPKKSLMNDLVHQAFAGELHEEFLEFMYPTYKEEVMQNQKEMKEEMKLKKEQMKLQSEIVGGFSVNEEEDEKEKRNDKFLKQQKREKLKLQRQKEKEKREKQQKRKKQMEERQRKKEAREEKKERIQERQRQRERNKEKKRDKKTKDEKDRNGRLLRSRST